MRIGIAGPLRITSLLPYLDANSGSSSVPNGLGGSGVVNIVVELLERGEEVTIYTLDQAVDNHVTLSGPRLRVHVNPYRQRARSRAKDLFRGESQGILNSIRNDPSDIVHAHWTYEFALGTLGADIPHLVTARDAPYSILKYDPTVYRAIRLMMSHQVVIRAKRMTTVSKYVQRHFERYFVGAPKISVIPNGIKNGRPSEVGTRQYTSERMVFATILEGWGSLKNGMSAIKAFQILRKNLPEARLMMLGRDYGVGEPASKWAAANDQDEGISFVGHLSYEELINVLSEKVDILLHPSREESFCMAILEAMSLGIPVIGGKLSGAVPSTIGPDAGILIDVRAPCEIADAMWQMASNASMRQAMGSAGIRRAREEYSIAAVVDQYVDLYRDILQYQ